jgi:hippurate hydrolase
MMRADMDALPIAEQSGLPYASIVTWTNPQTGEVVPVAHACGHDVHITSLVGTARQMAQRRAAWSGTLMLIAQPAEERILGAQAMKADGLWERFGQPDFALALHVQSDIPAGRIGVTDGGALAGADEVDIIVRGVGAHGASPHLGKDPILLASQIVVALQTLVSRDLPPRQAGVVTVGTFEGGEARNVITDREVTLRLTVRHTSPESREILLTGIRRIAEHYGRAAGLPDDRLPEVVVSDNRVPPVVNDTPLVRRLETAWSEAMGIETVTDQPTSSMAGDDFARYLIEPGIPGVHWRVGGTPPEDLERAAADGPPVAGNHSPLFKVDPGPSVRLGVESTVVALLELMAPGARAAPGG